MVSVILAVSKSNVFRGPTSRNKSKGVGLVWLGTYIIFPLPISNVLSHQILLIEYIEPHGAIPTSLLEKHGCKCTNKAAPFPGRFLQSFFFFFNLLSFFILLSFFFPSSIYLH